MERVARIGKREMLSIFWFGKLKGESHVTGFVADRRMK
jgi:hypothetical protein